MEEELKRKRGRPTVGLRVPLSLRVTPELKERLDDAAEQSGRSQSQEAEIRLEKSFDRQDLLPDVLKLAFGTSEEMAGIVMMLGEVISATEASCEYTILEIGEHTPKAEDVSKDEFRAHTLDQAVKAGIRVLEALRPSDAPESNDAYATRFANEMIRAVRGEPEAFFARRAKQIRALLGPVAERMTAKKPQHDELDAPDQEKKTTVDVEELKTKVKELEERLAKIIQSGSEVRRRA